MNINREENKDRKLKFKILGITGQARFGKDTLADFVRDFYKEYSFNKPTHIHVHKFGLADALKKGAEGIFKLEREELYGDMKDIEHQFWGMTPREILQKLGTECIRNVFGQDFWIRRAELEMLTQFAHLYIIPDIRFINEAEWVRASNGLVVHIIKGPSINKSMLSDKDKKHKSENVLEIYKEDLTIENNKTFTELRLKVEILVKHLNGEQ